MTAGPDTRVGPGALAAVKRRGGVRWQAGGYSVQSFRVYVAEGAPAGNTGELCNDPALAKRIASDWDAAAGYGGQESTGALFLSARNRLLAVRTLFVGTLDKATVEPRIVLRDALLLGAAAVIIFHNHPSGDPTPSREDREFTRRLVTAGEAVGVRILDHIVIGSSALGSVSFREAGLM